MSPTNAAPVETRVVTSSYHLATGLFNRMTVVELVAWVVKPFPFAPVPKPQIEELPYFEKVNSEFGQAGVKVILVSLDMPSMWKSRLEPFVEKKGLSSEVVILDDPKQNTWIPKVSDAWGGGIPATLIYNKDKRSFYERGFTYEELTKELNQFIN